MKVERYIKEYASAILRNKHISEQKRNDVEAILKFRERGNITAAEAMQLLFTTATAPDARLYVAAASIYYDTEHDALITLDQLQQEWEGMTEEEREERGTDFDAFLENCMTRNNGTLEHFANWISARMK